MPSRPAPPPRLGGRSSPAATLDAIAQRRNRREACRIAGVTPTVEHLNGEDPVKRIWSENGPRRSLTKGAKAMIAACMFPEPEKGGRGQKAVIVTAFTGVNQGSLSHARTVIALAPDLVADVKTGQSLADAYKTDGPQLANGIEGAGRRLGGSGTGRHPPDQSVPSRVERGHNARAVELAQ